MNHKITQIITRIVGHNAPAGNRTRMLGSAGPTDVHYHTGAKESPFNNIQIYFSPSGTIAFNEKDTLPCSKSQSAVLYWNCYT